MAWLSGQVAGRLLDRAGGDVKEAAIALGVEPAELKKILLSKR